MVAITARRTEDGSPARSTTGSKRIPRQLLHGLGRSRNGASEAERDQSGSSRSLWRQALLWPSSPAILKKSARIAALERNSAGDAQACRRNTNQNDLQSCGGTPGVNQQDCAANATVLQQNQRDDYPQNQDTGKKAEASLGECSSKRTSEEDNNLKDLSHCIKKLALCNLRSHGKATSICPTDSTSPLIKPLPSPPLSLVKRASLHQELRAFCANADSHITMFPDYFSDEEKVMVQEVAQELQLCCQVGEKNIAVYKLLGASAGHHQHQRAQHSSSGGANHNNVADDVFVDVHELAEHGKDGFIARLRLRRLSSGSGLRRNMLWDVAELSSTADGVTDPMAEGEGGVYAVQSKSSGQKLALFKPTEEERFVREGLIAGEGAVREEAAYVLDSRSNGFSGVPPTAVARLRLSSLGRAKQGAVQRFMASSIGSMESFGMPFDLEKAQEFVPVDQVHRIALLDIRLFNTDRHPGNILLIGEKKPYTMVPIDHGCILPSWFHMSEARFDWLEYPQCRVAFSPAALQYIAMIDAEQDAKVLRALGIREECVTTLKICTLFLQLAATRGKTLHWMGSFMVRDGCFQLPSQLELAVQRACERAGIPYAFKANQFDEQRGEIELGVLSRRPPNEFFLALEHLLLEAINSEGSSL